MSGLMAGRRRTRAAFQPVSLPALDVPKGSEDFDTRTERALADLADAVNSLGADSPYVADVDLAVGTTTIAHGRGRIPSFVTVTPKVADAAFAVGWNPAQPGNPRPEMQVQITSATAATVRVKVE